MGNIKNKTNSIIKKGITLVSDGLEPLEVGMANYLLNDPLIEAKARKRYELSKHCIEYEPVDYLIVFGKKIQVRMKDERIEGLSEMMVKKCGCKAPAFYRQDIEKLKEWNE